MKKHVPLLLYVFLMLISGKLISQPVVTPGSLPLYQDGKLYFKMKDTSHVVVKNKDTITNDPGGSFHSLFIKYHVTKTERPYTGLNAGLDKTYRISFNQPTRIDSFLLELSQISSDVDYAEKVPAVYTTALPSDPLFTVSPTPLYHLSLLNINLATNVYTSNPSNGTPLLAIVDNAILTSHEDLMANIGSSVTTWIDVADADSDPNPPLSGASASLFTHGTHVAGIAGAVTNNTVGVASIGWNSSKLMCVKSTSSAASGTTITNGYDGLYWAGIHGARVINMSWGGAGWAHTDYTLVAAIKNLDVVLVAAAGNDASSSPVYPAAYGEGTTGQTWEAIDKKLVISVAALDQNNDRAIWSTLPITLNGVTSYQGSNYGYWVDITAYGTNIMSTLAASTPSGNPINNQYGQLSGTSMAAPMVSGIAGLMRSYDMSKTADQVIDCLLQTANPDIYGTGHPSNQAGTLGYGRADAYAALRCLSSTCSVSPIAIISTSSPSLCPGATVTLTANQGSGYLWSTGSTLQAITTSTTGVYTVTVSYAGGCTATASITLPNADLTAHIDILENSGLAAGDGTVCGLFPITLYAHWGLSYQWQPLAGMGPLSPGGGGAWGPPGYFSLPFTFTESVTITDVGGCTGVVATASVLMQWLPLPTITIASTNTLVCPGTTVALTASGASTYTWQTSTLTTPPNPVGASVISNPYIAIPNQGLIYTATGVDNNGCYGSQTSSIVMTSPYASPWFSPVLSSSLSGTYNSLGFLPLESYLIDGNVNVSGVATFSNSDVLFAPAGKITVPSGSTLNIVGSHLHTCHNDLWQGIVVEDGGALYMNEISGVNSNLVEDAVRAVDMSNHTTSTLTTILDISKTIFNRNFIGINVANYQRSVATYSNPIRISNCVFTCRDLPSTNTVWPTSATTSSVDLRFATSATTGVAPPYLAQADYSAAATLKNPYASIPSQYGILLTSVGTSTGGTYYGVIIGDDSSPGNFNLFDSHSCGISAVSSNVKAVNNVFQNLPYNLANFQTGIGIKSNFNSGAPDGSLDLTASDPGVGNRFWNCFTGVSGNRLFNFGISNGIFRSTQSSTTATSTPGNCGINLGSGRFLYQMTGNEFTNINTGINVPLVAAPSCSACPGSIYAANLTIQQNTFSTGGGSNAYMNQAISVSVPNAVPLTLPASLVSPAIAKAVIELNVLTDVFRGIYINGFNGFPTSVSNNTISLADDNVFSLPQHGIDLSNTMSAYQTLTGGGAAQTQEVGNQVSGTGTVNAQAALFYNSMNVGFASPSLTCNDARNSYQGFVFYGQNALTTTSIQGTHWLANNMQDLAYGMYLSTSGIIGQQCNASFGMGNTWSSGSLNWPTGTFGIYSYTSYAIFSPLYFLSSGTSIPLNIDGVPNPVSYAAAGLAPHPTTVAAQANCSIPMQKTTPATLTPTYDSDDIAYIFNTGQFRFLRYNDSIKMANKTFRDFYTSMLASYPNAENLAEADEYLAAGDYASARSQLSAVTPTNTIEDNYKSFYGLYANYQNNLDDSTPYSSSDSTALYGLALLCPGHNGACVYQARALYTAIYNQVLTISDFCDTLGGARLAHFQNENIAETTIMTNDWNVTLFPNPATHQLHIVSNRQDDNLKIIITDVAGRQLLKQNLKTNNFIATLELSFANGAYLTTISNSDNKTVIKKLLIAE